MTSSRNTPNKILRFRQEKRRANPGNAKMPQMRCKMAQHALYKVLRRIYTDGALSGQVFVLIIKGVRFTSHECVTVRNSIESRVNKTLNKHLV